MRMSPTVAAVLVLLSCGLVAASGTQKPTDAQIAAIVVAANQVDIDAGRLARSKSAREDVRAFAESMIAAHTAVNEQAKALVAKLKVTPEENPTSEALKAGGEENVAKLEPLAGAAFDRAYVGHEVAYHQQVIDALDRALIPGASNAELKALLEKVRPAFVAHLEHARRLQAALSN